jgi:hypothetical protein
MSTEIDYKYCIGCGRNKEAIIGEIQQEYASHNPSGHSFHGIIDIDDCYTGNYFCPLCGDKIPDEFIFTVIEHHAPGYSERIATGFKCRKCNYTETF